MVMIDLGHEKKSLGVISVTRITNPSALAARSQAPYAKNDQVKGSKVGALMAPCRAGWPPG
jgi:hypothetical protein